MLPTTGKTIDNWHYHLQVGGQDDVEVVTDLIFFDTSEAISAFMRMLDSFDTPTDLEFTKEEYEMNAVTQMVLHTEKKMGIAIYFDCGDYRIRVANCDSCFGGSLN